MTTTKLPIGYTEVLSVFETAIAEGTTISQAARQLGADAALIAVTVREMREYYLEGFLDKSRYDAFMNLRTLASKGVDNKVKAKQAEETEAKRRKNRAKHADSENRADADANIEEDLAHTEAERDDKGRITQYYFNIRRRDKPELTGVFSRTDMERIVSLYPYVTQNALANEFPAYNTGEMKRILRAFNITKDTKFPLHVIEELTPEQQAEFALNAKERVAYKKLDLSRAGFIEKELRKTQTQVWELEEDRNFVNRTATAVLEYYIEQGRLSSAPSIPTYRPAFGEDRPVGEPALVFYGDTHFGKDFQTDRLRGKGRGTTAQILKERMLCLGEQCVEQLVRLDTTRLVLFNMGDIFESLLPDGMHAQHSQEMALQAEEQLLVALEAHEDFLQYVCDHAPYGKQLEITLHGLGGNHDRLGKTRDEDKRRTGALIFYTMLEKVLRYRLPGRVTIHTYPDGVFSVVEGRINVIGYHGDSPLAKVKTPELLNTFRSGDSSLYTMVVSAHYHSTVVEEGHNYTRMTIGPVCSADDYSQNQLSKGSQPSVMFAESARGYGVDLYKKTLY